MDRGHKVPIFPIERLIKAIQATGSIEDASVWRWERVMLTRGRNRLYENDGEAKGEGDPNPGGEVMTFREAMIEAWERLQKITKITKREYAKRGAT